MQFENFPYKHINTLFPLYLFYPATASYQLSSIIINNRYSLSRYIRTPEYSFHLLRDPYPTRPHLHAVDNDLTDSNSCIFKYHPLRHRLTLIPRSTQCHGKTRSERSRWPTVDQLSVLSNQDQNRMGWNGTEKKMRKKMQKGKET